MGPTTAIHVPASPTRRFANMLFFLVHSLAARARLPGPWRLVVTFGRDGPLGPGSAAMGWARDFPVEFRTVEPGPWAAAEDEARRLGQPGHVHNSTVLRQFAEPFDAEATLFLDADTVVAGPLGDLVERAAADDLLAAKPAWQPPPIDLGALLATEGLPRTGDMPYSGWGWSFLEPRCGPPYYNGGVIACGAGAAERLRRGLAQDYARVLPLYGGHFVWQVAQTLTILRQGIRCLPLDERWNLGIGAPGEPMLAGPEGDRLRALGDEQARDARVIHYCTPTPQFVRNRVMGSDAALRAFLAAEGLGPGEALLQAALRPYRDAWEDRLAGRG
jgi:hypothetical protein